MNIMSMMIFLKILQDKKDQEANGTCVKTGDILMKLLAFLKYLQAMVDHPGNHNNIMAIIAEFLEGVHSVTSPLRIPPGHNKALMRIDFINKKLLGHPINSHLTTWITIQMRKAQGWIWVQEIGGGVGREMIIPPGDMEES